MALNSRQIEQMAVTMVNRTIVRSNVLSPYIADNDKEPSWDGFIYLRAKTNERQRIAVQVKGKTKKKLPSSPTFPIHVHNLQSYLRDGGILYFVDFIVGAEEHLYYAKLAPIDLKRYIKQANGQQSIAVKLKPIKESLHEFETDVINFNRDCKRQASFADSPILTLEEVVKQGHKINFEVTGKDRNDAIRILQDNPVYLYAEFDNGGTITYYPIGDQAYSIMAGPHVKEKVVVNGINYYDEFAVFETKDNYTFVVGNVLTMTSSKSNDNRNKSKAQFKSHATLLSEKIKELSFINDLFLYKEINFGQFKIIIKDADSKILQEVSEELCYWRKVKSLFERLCIFDDVNMREFNTVDYDNLRMLVKAIIDGKLIEHKENIDIVAHTDIGQYRICLLAEKQEEGMYKISNFFESEEKMCYAYDKDDDKKYLTSMFTIAFMMKDFYKFSNVNYELLIPSYEALVDKNPDIYERANWDLLLALNAYDKQQSKSERLYDAIVELNDWLLSNHKECYGIHIVNKYQIVKRKRHLNKTEKNELIALLENSECSTMLKFGINLLLDNKGLAENLFEEMSDDEKKQLQGQPILHFVNN